MLSYCHCRKKSIRSKKTANSNNDNALVCGFDVCSGDQNLRITGHCTTFQTYFKFLWFSYFDSNSLNESRKMQQNGSMIKSQNYHNSLGQTTLYTRLTRAKVLLSARLMGSTVWIACLIRHLCTIIPRLLIAPIMYVPPASGIFCKTSRTTLQRSSSVMLQKVFLLAIRKPSSCRLHKIVRYETPVSQATALHA